MFIHILILYWLNMSIWKHLLQRLILNLILLLCFVSTSTPNQFQLDILRPKLAPAKKRSGSLRTARRFSKPSPVAKDLLRSGDVFCWVFCLGWDEAIEIIQQQFCLMRSATWICEIDTFVYIYTDLTGILETWFARLKNYLGVVGLKGIFACDLKDYSSRIVISKTDPSEDLGQHVAVHGYTAGRKLKQYLKINQWKVSGI